MTWLQAFLLGAVQGLTEFLPVSSSGHLVLVPWLFGWSDPGLAYNVLLHAGTLVAVLLYFIKDWVTLVRAGIQSILERRIGIEKDRLLFWYLVVATIPAAVAGFLLHDVAETAFRSPLVIAVALAVVGFLLFWADGRAPQLKRADDLRMHEAIRFGIAQAFAIIPGTSRSGVTMMVGRWMGFRREDAARISFLMSFPIILGAFVFEVPKLSEAVGSSYNIGHLVIGFLSSFVFGILSIHGLLQFLRWADFQWFAWYRIILAGVILYLSL